MVVSKDRGLETLQVWQQAIAFATYICKEILPMLPNEEKWALTDQLRRSAQSIPANLAESYGRYYYQDSVRFCYIARGSLEETFSHLTLANKLGYISDQAHTSLIQEIDKLRRMVNGYIAFLKRSKRGANESGSKPASNEKA